MFLKESHLIEIEKKEGKSAKDLQHVNCHHISHSGENIIRPFKCFSLQYTGSVQTCFYRLLRISFHTCPFPQSGTHGPCSLWICSWLNLLIFGLITVILHLILLLFSFLFFYLLWINHINCQVDTKLFILFNIMSVRLVAYSIESYTFL